jgi:hypothetical protein
VRPFAVESPGTDVPAAYGERSWVWRGGPTARGRRYGTQHSGAQADGRRGSAISGEGTANGDEVAAKATAGVGQPSRSAWFGLSREGKASSPAIHQATNATTCLEHGPGAWEESAKTLVPGATERYWRVLVIERSLPVVLALVMSIRATPAAAASAMSAAHCVERRLHGEANMMRR